MSQPGHALILIGAPCAGKTTLSEAFQDAATEHYLRLGIDTFFATVSKRWAGGPMGPLHRHGFEYTRKPPSDGHPILQIAYGDVGWQILRGMHDAVAALVHAGNNVIFDDMPLDARALLDWHRALADVPARVILLDVPLHIAEQREQGRRERLHGLARGHHDLITSIDEVDLRLDATLALPQLTTALLAYADTLAATPTGIRLRLR